MDPSLRTAASGMVAQQIRIDVIANNLANVNTTGFKRSRAHFEDLLYQTKQGESVVDQADAESLPGIQVGRGTRLAAVARIGSQGPIQQTGRPFDLAMEGEGFFQVTLPGGRTGYTRDGSFSISDQGTLVNHSGYTVVPGINIPADARSVVVSKDGSVSVTLGDDTPVEVGRIELARFPNEAGLRALGENILAETAASGSPVIGLGQEDGFGRIVSGALEASNVEIVQEMVDMIAAMRAFELGSKVIQTSEDMARLSSDLVR